MLHEEWNGVAHARGHNVQDSGNRGVWKTGGRVWKKTNTGKGIRLKSLNIRTGRARGMDTALKTLYQGNVDVGFIQETNMIQGIHT